MLTSLALIFLAGLAGASCDDVFVSVLFTTFVSMAQGGEIHAVDFINIPVSILLRILLGAAAGFLLSLFFKTTYGRGHCVMIFFFYSHANS